MGSYRVLFLPFNPDIGVDVLDIILNGQGHGSIASTLLRHNFDTGALRPYIDTDDGRHYYTVTNNRGEEVALPLTSNTATMRKDEWEYFDRQAIKVAKPRMKAVADLIRAGLVLTIPNGMAYTVIQYQTMSDISPATISMDGLRRSENDRPVYDLRNLPLPLIHKDFSYPAREVMVSRNMGMGLDTATLELAARRVAEESEKLLIGVSSSYSYAGGTIYGYTNFPDRITMSLTQPGTGGWTPATTLAEVLAMKQLSKDNYYYGPWVLYHSTGFDVYMEDDFSGAKGDNTLRSRLRAIDGITDVRPLDYLTGNQLLLVQMTSDVVRLVNGLSMRTLQWTGSGDMELFFKVIMLQVPQLRSDNDNNSGIVHASV